MPESYRLEWIGPPKPEYETKIRKDIDDLLASGLPSASVLVFHEVLLTDQGTDGPIVHTWGKDEAPGVLFCEYDHDPVWVSLA